MVEVNCSLAPRSVQADRSGFITRNKESLKKRRGKRTGAIPTLVVGESQ